MELVLRSTTGRTAYNAQSRLFVSTSVFGRYTCFQFCSEHIGQYIDNLRMISFGCEQKSNKKYGFRLQLCHIDKSEFIVIGPMSLSL